MYELKKTGMMGLPGRERSLIIPLTVSVQNTSVTDRRRDRETDTGRRPVPWRRAIKILYYFELWNNSGRRNECFLLSQKQAR